MLGIVPQPSLRADKCLAKRRTKRLNLAYQQIVAATNRKIYRKEIATAVDAKSFVCAHCKMILQARRIRFADLRQRRRLG
jgi:hypothetical protein